MPRYHPLPCLLALLSLLGACSWMPLEPGASPSPGTTPWPSPVSSQAPASPLPAWRGFNLTEMFHRDSADFNQDFQEQDFVFMREQGFDFARLPLDYRIWTVNGDWYQVDEAALARLDQAVAWGRAYGVHVCLNLHRAPGYTVASPAEATSVWTDPATQAACVWHWRLLARRYRTVPPADLSFNLFNEPAGVAEADYLRVVQLLVNAIHQESPGRRIFIDGLDYGASVLDLSGLSDAWGERQGLLGLSVHCYQPFNLTHYQAGWIAGADTWAPPAWPYLQVPAFMYGSGKAEWQSPLTVRPAGTLAAFPAGTVVRLHVGTVSDRLALALWSAGPDGTASAGTRLWNHNFDCSPASPDSGIWESTTYQAAWNIWQNVWNHDYRVTLAEPAAALVLAAGEGDWLTLTCLGITLPGSATEAVLDLDATAWGQTRQPVSFDGQAFAGGDSRDRDWLRRQLAPFAAARARGVPVMVQEFGVHNRTPHGVALAWLADLLAVVDEAGLGRAQWNLRGSFGVLDSGRSDVDYTAWQGHRLDQAMLDLIRSR